AQAAWAFAHWQRRNKRARVRYTNYRRELASQITLVHDVFSNPFHSAPATNSAWLSWRDGTVVKLAEAIYEERAFDRLPILADALEDAGCDNAVILGHCRQTGEHVRGCWVVDLLLGKQ